MTTHADPAPTFDLAGRRTRASTKQQGARHRSLWRRALYFGLGAVSLGPALKALSRGDNERAAVSLARTTHDEALLQGATSAALRGARSAEAKGRLLEACRFWVAFQMLTGDSEKAITNAKRCARNVTAKRADKRQIAQALQAWGLVAALDPRSQEARQGITWCHAALARWAERDNDFIRARLHWSKAVEVSPRSPAAVEGLRRSLGDQRRPETNNTARTWEDMEALTARLKNAASGRHASHSVAGQLLLQLGAPERAADFLRTAWKQNPGKETAVALFSCLAALRRFEEAGSLLHPLMSWDMISAIRPSELCAVLTHLAPSVAAGYAREMLGAKGLERFAPVLLPSLLRASDTAAVLDIASAADPDTPGWTCHVVLETASFLRSADEELAALRLLALFSDFEEAGAIFLAQASAYEPDVLQGALLSPGDPRGDVFCLAVAEFFLARGDASRAVGVLGSLGASGAGYPLDRHRKERWSKLFSQLLARGADPRELARAILSWLPVTVKRAFASKAFDTLLGTLSTAARSHNAPENSRLGILREGYFNHHLERREGQLAEGFGTELGFGEAAIRYFEAVSGMRSAETAPVSAALAARLGKPLLPFGDGHSADLLMSCALLRETVQTDLRGKLLFQETARWFLDGFMRAHGIPSGLLGPDVLASFNAASAISSPFGIRVTRFANLLCEETPDYESQYELDISLDALLFTLEVVAALLPTCLHYRELVAGMLPCVTEREGSFADACIAELAGPVSGAENFSRLLSYCTPFHAKAPSPMAARDQPQDVLLIGHGGAGTGLSRNLQMLQKALSAGGIALTTLAYEQQPAAFAASLRTWRSKCNGRPIVVAAVNAHDLPSIFVRDRHDVLEDCYVAGFFLWETSKAPQVQHLGIRLVDEIWVPTRYVAEVYAPFAPVHIVGKGLFPAAKWPEKREHERAGRFRFLTVFDFHSSVERKNPLAVVLAFQKAFADGEKVELLVKASNVNPQHPGNASGQWERLTALGVRDPRIKIVTERYTEGQMQQMMRETSCVVSLHRSEGFAYVLSDAMAAGIPVIGTAYSGNVDFCDEATSFPVSYELVPVRAHGTLWEDESAQWAEPDIASAAFQMRRVYEDYPAALRKTAIGRQKLMAEYSAEVFAATLRRRIEAIRTESLPDR